MTWSSPLPPLPAKPLPSLMFSCNLPTDVPQVRTLPHHRELSALILLNSRPCGHTLGQHWAKALKRGEGSQSRTIWVSKGGLKTQSS